jgi:hypothetical protein
MSNQEGSGFMFFTIPYSRIEGAVAVGFKSAMLLCFAASMIVAQNREAPLRSVRDMIVVQKGSMSAIFVSDNTSGWIYMLAQPDQTGPIDFAAFKQIARLKQPSGLAFHNGSLFVADPAANAVLKLDLANNFEVTKVELPELLSQPEHISFSDAEVMAVGSDKRIQFFPPKGDVATAEAVARDVDRIFFDGRSLIVLDENARGDLSIIEAQRDLFDQHNVGFAYSAAFTEAVRRQLPSIQDFAFYRGIYYIAGRNEVFALSRSQLQSAGGAQALRVPLPEGVEEFAKIAVSNRMIYLADSKRGKIWVVRRPVPVVVDFPSISTNPLSYQLQIINAIKGKYLLTQTATDRRYDSINELTRSYLFSGLEELPKSLDNPTLADIGKVICDLNEWTCEKRKTNDGEDLIKLRGNVGAGNRVILPTLQIKDYTVEKPSGTGSGLSDLSGFLQELEVVPLALDNKFLAVGQLIHVEPGQHATPQKLTQCLDNSVSGVTSVPVSFPNEIALTLDEFSNQIGLSNGPLVLQKMRAVRVVVNYDNVKSERVEDSVTKSRACMIGVVRDPNTYVVDGMLLAEGANYRFLDAKGKNVSVNPKLLSSAQVSGEIDSTKQWMWTVRSRLKLGYTALRFEQSEQTAFPKLTYLKPETPIRTQHGQQITFLVDSEQGLITIKELNDLASKFSARFYATLGQDQVRASENAFPPDSKTAPALTLDDAKEERRKLRELIHFPEELSNIRLFNLKIGIVENPSTIESTHQCFVTKDGWAWGELQTSDTPQTNTANNPQANTDAGNVKDQTITNGPNSEHGTHVAGIIGARRFLTGLTPSVRLIAIDPTKLNSDITNNIAKIKIFNFSTVPPGVKDDYKALINRIAGAQTGQNVLFVIAAGNESHDFSDGGEVFLPVSWLKELPHNVLIVGSATSVEPLNLRTGSNYSKRYVQLLAPGEGIFSCIKGNSYGPASGTSQAAPQVTAVAALLKRKGLIAQWIKAVLIYSADWREDVMELAWGGFLNAQAAFDAANSEKNQVIFEPREAPVFLTPPENQGKTIKIKSGAIINDPNQPKATFDQTDKDLEIPFGNVLRLQKVTAEGTNKGRFRVIYLDPKTGEMTMLLNATVEGNLYCRVLRDADGQPLQSDRCSEYPMANKDDARIPFEKFVDYIRNVPFGTDDLQVTFPIPK